MIDDMAVYIANLGKYNEGYLVGAWFTFPIDEEDVKEKIGLNEQYEDCLLYTSCKADQGKKSSGFQRFIIKWKRDCFISAVKSH